MRDGMRYLRSSGHAVEDDRRVRHPIYKWRGTTLDDRVQQTGAVFEVKFMLPWNLSEEAARLLLRTSGSLREPDAAPPPFSGMNSTPAFSSAVAMAAIVSSATLIGPQLPRVLKWGRILRLPQPPQLETDP